MGDEIVALVRCTVAWMLLGMKKILDAETAQCLGSCVDSLREEEREA